jgi:hypothetical protein
LGRRPWSKAIISGEDGNNADVNLPDCTRHHGDASQQKRTIVPSASIPIAPLAGTLLALFITNLTPRRICCLRIAIFDKQPVHQDKKLKSSF